MTIWVHGERISRTSLAIVTATCLLTMTATAGAQDTRRDLTIEIADLADDVVRQLAVDGQASIASPMNRARLLTIAGILVRIPRTPLSTVEDARLDEQLGAAPDSPGTTNLVSLSGSPSIFAAAVEHGAFWQSSGTTATLRVTPAGAAAAIAGRRFGEMLAGGRASWAGRVAFSATYDTSPRDQSAEPAIDSDQSRLAQWTTRIAIFNRRKLADPYLRWLWTTQPGLSPADITAANDRAWEEMNADPAFVRWRTATDVAIAAARREASDIAARLLTRFRQFPAEGADAPPGEQLGAASTSALRLASVASSTLVATPASALSAGLSGSTLTMEYVNNLPILAPAFSTIRLIRARGGNEATGNVALTFFHDAAAAGRRLRDFELAGQIEGALRDQSAVTVALGMRFQYFPDDPAPTPTGPDTSSATVWGFQWMVTVRPRGTGIRIPLSFSFANRTEERQERDARASVGLAYDFDAVFARLRP